MSIGIWEIFLVAQPFTAGKSDQELLSPIHWAFASALALLPLGAEAPYEIFVYYSPSRERLGYWKKYYPRINSLILSSFYPTSSAGKLS